MSLIATKNMGKEKLNKVNISNGAIATKDAQRTKLRFHKNKKKAPERELFSLLYFF
jgi:hypothetical protein